MNQNKALSRVILKGTVGSVAYGLNTENSDHDTFGVYIAPLKDVLGLNSHAAVTNTIDIKDPDTVIHELGKFCALGLKSNPSCLEVLWLNSYDYIHPEWGYELINMRKDFLSYDAVLKVYTGFVKSQLGRISRGEHKDRPDRQAKHGRHLFRLLIQGNQLLCTGNLQIDMTYYRDYLFELGGLVVTDPDKFINLAEKQLQAFVDSPTILPEHPNRDKINDFIVYARTLAGNDSL